MITTSYISGIIDETLEGTDMFVVSLKVSESNLIQVIVDADSGLSIDQCVRVSRSIESQINRDEEDFELQVTSPGLSNPLVVTRQYIKNVGRDLKVTMNSGEVHEGNLIKADEEGVVLEYSYKQRIEGRKKKEVIAEQLPLSYEDIKEAKVMISFK